MSILTRLGFHEHQWHTTHVTFTPPARKPWEASGFVTQEFIDQMTFGLTSVTQICTVTGCQKVDVKNYPGRVDIPGFTWNTTTKEAYR